jgi:MFS transporter, DHA1 family, inner membrane transport protein
MLLLWGGGSVVGNLVGGYAADRWGGTRAVTISLIGVMLMLTAMPFVATSLIGAGIIVPLWSMFGWMLVPAQQARLIALAPDRAPVILALNASAIYLGAAGGAALGGTVLNIAAPAALGRLLSAVGGRNPWRTYAMLY